LPVYIGQYRKYHPAETRRDVWCKIPICEGYVEIAVAMSLDGWLQFSGITLADGGYIRQEMDKILSKPKCNTN
jgi:hypothetical protein